MKCLSCDCILTDYEATRKYTNGTYIDLCNRCFLEADFDGLAVLEREDLKDFDILDEEDYYNESDL